MLTHTQPKRIGIVASRSQENGNISVPQAYVSYFSKFGIVVPIFALDEYVNKEIDLLVLTGGADVYPERYGEKPHIMTQNPQVELEWFDKYMLPQYVDANISIFGICRGFQTLNVHFGGKLNQHIYQNTSTKSRDEKVDDLISTVQGQQFCIEWNIFSNKNNKPFEFGVNSLHHQGVSMNILGNDVIPLFTNKLYNNIEVFTVRNKPIVAVQYHPEELSDTFSARVITKLLG